MYPITTISPRDRQLLEGLAASNTVAIREIYDEVLPSIQYYVRQNGGDDDAARDVFQDALMALYRRLGSDALTLTCSLKSYLRVMCRNLWLKRLRRDTREAGVLPEGQEVADLDDSMQQRMEGAEREGLLWRHFETLEAGCQSILKRFFAGESLRNIAQQMDTSEGYIKKRKHICKERLVASVRADARFLELVA